MTFVRVDTSLILTVSEVLIDRGRSAVCRVRGQNTSFLKQLTDVSPRGVDIPTDHHANHPGSNQKVPQQDDPLRQHWRL